MKLAFQRGAWVLAHLLLGLWLLELLAAWAGSARWHSPVPLFPQMILTFLLAFGVMAFGAPDLSRR